jgi:hypothetical protein
MRPAGRQFDMPALRTTKGGKNCPGYPEEL